MTEPAEATGYSRIMTTTGSSSRQRGPQCENDDEARLAKLLVTAGRFARAVNRAQRSTHAIIVWRVLGTLEADGPMRMTWLAANESVSQGAMTTTMQRVEAAGLVTRRADPTDGRATLFEITDKGKAELEQHRSTVARALLPYVSGISALDRAAIDRVIELMGAMANQQSVQARQGRF
ncbi:transcriptional regulator [Microbacterium sp. HM58-2]|nr:transcriptional regulator [Microbacterium sp. HM58-2]